MITEPEYDDHESRYEARVFHVTLRCNKCNGGDFRPIAPPENGYTMHACTYCTRQKNIEGKPYPRIEYKPSGSR